MGLVSKLIPNFINGVSQQPPALRLSGQGEIQENGLSDVVDGLKKRPPSRFKKKLHITTPNGSTFLSERDIGNAFFHSYQRSNTEQYTVVYVPKDSDSQSNSSATDAKVYVYDIGGNLRYESGVGSFDAAGNTIPVPATDGFNYTEGSEGDNTESIATQQTAINSYFGTASKDKLKATSVSDYTFLVNKDKVVEKDTSTPSDPRPHEAVFYMKVMNFAKKYKMVIRDKSTNAALISGHLVTRDGGDGDAHEEVYGLRSGKYFDIVLDPTQTVEHGQTSGGSTLEHHYSSDFDQINPTEFAALDLETARNTGDPMVVVRSDATTYTGVSSAGKVGFNVDVNDENGGNDFKAFKGTATTFTELPRFCVDNFTIQVNGDNQKKEDDFYVKFTGSNTSGTWKECAAPSRPNAPVYHSLKADTMPHTLLQNSNGSFTFTSSSWDRRNCGDDDTNPFPSFVGNTINDVFFHRNRLGFLSDENVIFSEASNYFNFFRVTVRSLLDSAPVDVGVSQNEVSVLKHAIPFQEKLLMFSDLNQFSLSSDTLLTPSEVAIDTSTNFECDLDAKPAAAGKTVFFATASGDVSGVREFITDVNLETNDAPLITSHIPTYIQGNIKEMIGSSNEDMLICRTSGSAKELYIYKWYEPDQERLQSSWSKWIFDTDIVHIKFNNSTLFIVFADGRFETLDLTGVKGDQSLTLDLGVSGNMTSIGTYSAQIFGSTYYDWTGYNDGSEAPVGTTIGSTDNSSFTQIYKVRKRDTASGGTPEDQFEGAYIDITVNNNVLESSGNPTTSDLPQSITVGGLTVTVNTGNLNTNSTWTPENFFRPTIGSTKTQFIQYISASDYNALWSGGVPQQVKLNKTLTLTTGIDHLLDHLTIVQGVTSSSELSNFYIPTANTIFVDHKGSQIAEGQTPASTLYTYLAGTHIKNGVSQPNFVYVGEKYNFKYQLSEQVFKPSQGDISNIARFQLKSITFTFNDTGTFDVTVDSTGRDPKVSSFSGRIVGDSNNLVGFDPTVDNGTFKVGVLSQAKETKITINNISHKPCVFQSAEWEGEIVLRGTRI